MQDMTLLQNQITPKKEVQEITGIGEYCVAQFPCVPSLQASEFTFFLLIFEEKYYEWLKGGADILGLPHPIIKVYRIHSMDVGIIDVGLLL